MDELYKSLPDVVYGRLRQRILEGDLSSGDWLKQEEVAAQYDISRVPVREALSRLEREGLLAFKPRRGYAVASFDVDEIEEIFDIRTILEERAAYLATLNRTKEDIAAVEDLLVKMNGLTVESAVNTSNYAIYNRAFHNRLFLSSGRSQLVHLAELQRDKLERYIRLDASSAGRVGDAEHEHRSIFDAFVRGDAEAAARLSREHCKQTCDCLIASINSRNEADAPAKRR